MLNVCITVLMCFVALTIIVLALSGDAVVWQMPGYRRFKRLVNDLEHASVGRVKGVMQPQGLTLGLVGRHRIPEYFETPLQAAQAITIGDCFGAIFLRDESIDDAVALIRTNAWVVLIISLFGTLLIVFGDPSIGTQIAQLNFWAKVPFVADLLFQNHVVLFTELLVIVISLFYLLHNARLLRRLNRTFGLNASS